MREIVKRHKTEGILFLFALFTVTLCSMTSFLFPLHDRVDQNCFFTIGRGILQGKVVYRDMAEQKGIYVYLFNALCARISSERMIGVYFFQVLSFTLLLYFLYKTAALFLQQDAPRRALRIACVTGAVIATTQCYLRGDNVEEFAIMLMALSVYRIAKGELTGADVFLEGLITALLLWIKFTMLGFWLGWFLLYFGTLLRRRQVRRFFGRGALFLCGLLLGTAPILAYCLCTHSLYDCLYQYFYANIFMYSKHLSVWGRIWRLIEAIAKNFGQNTLYFTLIHIGLVSMIRNRDGRWPQTLRRTMLLGYGTLFLGTFGGGVWYDYYYLIAGVYVLFGVLVVSSLLREGTRPAWVRIRSLLARVPVRVRPVAATAALLAFVTLASNCLPFYTKKRDDYPQEKFAKIVRANGEGTTLLNFGFLDQGFYLACGIEPTIKFFCRLNIPEDRYPEMYEAQWEQIAGQKVDFVVIRMLKSGSFDRYDKPEIFRYYTIVAEAEAIHDPFRFALLARVPTAAADTKDP